MPGNLPVLRALMYSIRRQKDSPTMGVVVVQCGAEQQSDKALWSFDGRGPGFLGVV